MGVWGGIAGSPDVTGIKAMRWMERSGSEGTIHVSNSGYMENDAPAELELDGTDKVFILHDLTTPQLTKQVRDGILARLEEKEAQA